MRARRITALAVCGTAGLAGLQPQAAQASGNTVYVDSDTTICSDTAATAGSQATPFCSLPTALASPAVVSGTVVQLSGFWNGGTTGGVDVTKSDLTIQADPHSTATFYRGAFGLSISGRHDVTLRGLHFKNQIGEAIKVAGSSGITVDSVEIDNAQTSIAAHTAADPAIRFDGASNSALTDSDLLGGGGLGVLVDAGSSGVVVANDVVSGQIWGGVAVADSSAVDVVADTVDGNCANAVAVSGTATDVRIENDIAAADPQGGQACYSGAPAIGLNVAASASAGTAVGHTIAMTTGQSAQAIQWAGTDYSDAAAFDAAGHGSGDLTADPGFADPANWSTGLRESYQLAATSPAIDSADGSARNEPLTDQVGSARKPDPVAVDAALGVGTPSYADRGALEFQPYVPANQLQLSADPHIGTYLHVSASLEINPKWPVTSCAFDFGNGYLPASASCTAAYTYPGPGSYPVSVRVADAYGHTWTDSATATLQPQVVQPSFATSQFNGLLTVDLQVPPGLTTAVVDYGDGSPLVTVSPLSQPYFDLPPHQYPSSGTYTITVTGTDNLGFSGSTSQSADVVTYVHPTIRRIAGGNRYQTAVAASQAQWASGTAGAVVLASGTDYPDALTGVPLAAHVHGPLLLSDPKSLDPATVAEITRVLGPGSTKTVYLLGGQSALSDAVAAALPASVHVVRIGGADRFETARLVAQAIGPTNGVVVASGLGFADALAAGPLAVKQGAAILLSDGTTLDPATAAAVASHSSITAVGGPAAVAVRADIDLAGKTFTDLHGADRYATAAAVVDATVGGDIPQSMSVASGANFPDALAGGAFAATAGQPLLLTDPSQMSAYIDVRLELWHLFEWNGTVSVFGGPAAVSDTVVAQIQRDTNSRFD